LRFFDPACGSGNFLTETYISLRRLENTVLSERARHQASLVFEDVEKSPVKVNVNQLYGIELNDFAVCVAQTAVWVAKIQADLDRHQTSLVFEDVEKSPVKVNVNQFYGIEINDFAVSVAQTALWIAKLQADLETDILTSGRVNILPLMDSPNIVQGNALQ